MITRFLPSFLGVAVGKCYHWTNLWIVQTSSFFHRQQTFGNCWYFRTTPMAPLPWQTQSSRWCQSLPESRRNYSWQPLVKWTGTDLFYCLETNGLKASKKPKLTPELLMKRLHKLFIWLKQLWNSTRCLWTCLNISRSLKLVESRINPLEIKEAKLIWINCAQREVFESEISSIEAGKPFGTKSCLTTLTPFLSELAENWWCNSSFPR